MRNLLQSQEVQHEGKDTPPQTTTIVYQQPDVENGLPLSPSPALKMTSVSRRLTWVVSVSIKENRSALERPDLKCHFKVLWSRHKTKQIYERNKRQLLSWESGHKTFFIYTW